LGAGSLPVDLPIGCHPYHAGEYSFLFLWLMVPQCSLVGAAQLWLFPSEPKQARKKAMENGKNK
jgi:hypothetical protein